MTPRARTASGIRWMALNAPRTLKAPIGCSCSHLSATECPVRAASAGISTSGVRTATPSMAPAARWTSSIVTAGRADAATVRVIGST